jgi:hypothetical protein
MRAYVKTKFGDEVEEVEEAEYAPRAFDEQSVSNQFERKTMAILA